jgi:DNA modification methylase
MSWTIHHGDCREVMATLDAESVDAIVTDPPYGLSFMGKGWDHGVPGVEFWAKALRVAKPGAHLLAFGGTRTYHRLACAIEDAGWEIRDCVMWVYGSGFPKSHNMKGEWSGWGTALKPAWEPIIVARKPLVGTVAENVLTHGTGAINVDGCRVGTEGGTQKGSKPQGDGRGIYGAGLHGACEIKQLNAGRWPANLIHDGSEEVVGLFPAKVKGGTWNRTAGARHFHNDGEPTGYQTSGSDGTTGSAARFFYCAKASKADRDEGCEGLERRTWQEHGYRDNATSHLSPRAGAGRTSLSRNHHPTVKPTALMRYLCRLVTPPGGIVLDPFTGSGSTGKGAVLEGFQFIGIEREAEYVEIAKARIGAATPKGTLF